LGDLSGVTEREALAAVYREAYPDASPSRMANHVGQLWAFVQRISVGDWVVVPWKTFQGIAVGRVESAYEYRDDLEPDMRHTRRVSWVKTDIARSAFEPDLLYSFGAFMTVCQVTRNDAEARVRLVVEGHPRPSNGEEPKPDVAEVAKDEILAFISRRFKGHHLARLVEGVFEAQGYVTRTSPPGRDGGVDILAGSGPMGLDAPRICIQVKSSDGRLDVDVFRAFLGVKQQYNAEQGLLVGWGGFTQPALAEAGKHFFSVRLWDKSQLLDAVLAHYARLPEDLRTELPLRQIWALRPTEPE
jgi:restriction system protein